MATFGAPLFWGKTCLDSSSVVLSVSPDADMPVFHVWWPTGPADSEASRGSGQMRRRPFDTCVRTPAIQRCGHQHTPGPRTPHFNVDGAELAARTLRPCNDPIASTPRLSPVPPPAPPRPRISRLRGLRLSRCPEHQNTRATLKFGGRGGEATLKFRGGATLKFGGREGDPVS